MSYSGPDRRRRKVYVTRNTEYYMLDRQCVVVRDMQTGQARASHKALGATLVGAFRISNEGNWIANFEQPAVGEKLCFSTDVMTTPVMAIRRSERDAVQEIHPGD